MASAPREPLRWAIVTGEYPPSRGGVSDYTRILARLLAAAGDEVHVFAPGEDAADPGDPGVRVHRLADHFSVGDLRAMRRTLESLPRPYRVLVQYVPQSFGRRGANLPFCLWLGRLPRGDVWVMFHEVVFPLERGQPLKHKAYGVITRVMAGVVCRAASEIFVSTRGWTHFIRRLAPSAPEPRWLPIPSNLPTEADPRRAAAIRGELVGEDGVLIGHFGTYGAEAMAGLRAIVPALLEADRRRRVLLMGRGSAAFADQLRGERPGLGDRIAALGGAEGEEVVAHLAACHLLVQPCEGGVTARRSSVMAGLALGAAIVTNDGEYTEPLWHESGAVALAADRSPRELVAAAEAVLADAAALAELGIRARALYHHCFDFGRTVDTLRELAAEAAGGAPAGPPPPRISG